MLAVAVPQLHMVRQVSDVLQVGICQFAQQSVDAAIEGG
jgi:hypothetical protein